MYQLLITLSTNAITDSEIRLFVYPNPTSGHLKVDSKNLRVEEIQIFDASGKLILKTQETSFSINHLPKGVYSIKIKTEKGYTIEKIVKQ